MATINKTLMAAVMLLLGFIVANFGITDAQVGVCCGLLGNNLPPISEVVALYKSNNIKRMRIYDASHAVLNALKGSNIELILGVPNSELQRLTDASSAASWVQSNVVPFWPSVKIRYIAVGNEVSPIHQASLAQSLRPALVNVFNAVRSAGLHEKIKVSTAIDTTLIGKSYPPSEGAFRDDVRWFVDPIIGHLVWAKTPILANIYTYFSYVNNPADISLPYALFTSPSISVWDQGRGYQNLFDAMLDALYSSLEGAWGGDLDVVVSESGWPSAGGTGATLDNARTYYTNLIKHVKGGTPKRPNKPIETYLFALFNENQKSPELEKNFGVFYPNKQPKYNLNFGAQRNWDLLADQHNSTTLSLSSDM